MENEDLIKKMCTELLLLKTEVVMLRSLVLLFEYGDDKLKRDKFQEMLSVDKFNLVEKVALESLLAKEYLEGKAGIHTVSK